MKINYEKSKIYKITNKEGLYFIDRTTDTYLSKRLIFLRKSYENYLKDNKKKYEPYFKIFENGEYTTISIEDFKCENIKQLKTRVEEIVNLEENKNELCLNHKKVPVKRNISKVKCEVCKVEVALNQKARHEKGKFHNSFLKNVKEEEVEIVYENEDEKTPVKIDGRINGANGEIY